MPPRRPAIKHIVQLMLENRSFDQMLGFLYGGKPTTPDGTPFAGLTGSESNLDANGRTVTISTIVSTTQNPYLRPGADPGEGFYNTNIQLFSAQQAPANAVPTNQGFVLNFQSAIASDAANHFSDSLPGTLPADIMEAYAPEMLPIMSTLATRYAVCDHWFASAPTQTVPNRAFAAAATSLRHLDNVVKVFTCPSIFGRLADAGQDWSIFGYSTAPLTRLDFPDTMHADESHFGLFADFQQRAAAGTLAPYTFLEPSWGANGNSQHPNYDVAQGEQLISDVYRALRTGPGWNETLLIITYDEHGGNYDHVAPPATAVTPDNSVGEFDNFTFNRFGVRVPALLISPYIKPGTVYRASSGTIDHTSVLKTIEECWNLPPFTKRDAAAPSLSGVLTLSSPRTDDPLQGVLAPVSAAAHPNQAMPSTLEKLHAWRLSQLPIPNAQGTFGHTPPDLSSSAAIQDYIRSRSAAWSEHLRRTPSLGRTTAARTTRRSGHGR